MIDIKLIENDVRESTPTDITEAWAFNRKGTNLEMKDSQYLPWTVSFHKNASGGAMMSQIQHFPTVRSDYGENSTGIRTCCLGNIEALIAL